MVGKTVRLKDGSKLKIKKKFYFFDQTICQTKIGFVWTGFLYGRPEKEVFGSLSEAEQTVFEVIKSENRRFNTYVHRVEHCISKWQAFYERDQWVHPGSDNEKIIWGNDGGKAVAVRLDCMGRAVEFLSLCDWSNQYGWGLPAEGDWHYFNSSIR